MISTGRPALPASAETVIELPAPTFTLATAKALVQLGATLGREFAYELLRGVSPWDEDTLQVALGRLVDAELLYHRGYPSDATYLFKHALIQAAAYQSLLKRTRQQYHRQCQQKSETHFALQAQCRLKLR